MIEISPGSRQLRREPWTMDCFIYEWSIALGLSIDENSHNTYTSVLNSYLTFCKLHCMPVEPTKETLSFFTIFMSSHIKPDSVNSYLSGIANQLKGLFPNVHKNRNSILVSQTLTGCKHCFGTSVHRKRPLSRADLLFLIFVKLSIASPKWTTWTDSNFEALASAYVLHLLTMHSASI